MQADLIQTREKNARLEQALLLSMGMVDSLKCALHHSMTLIRQLETTLAVNQHLLIQTLEATELDPENVKSIVSALGDCLRSNTVLQDPPAQIYVQPQEDSQEDF